jgi:hypothetical protein
VISSFSRDSTYLGTCRGDADFYFSPYIADSYRRPSESITLSLPTIFNVSVVPGSTIEVVNVGANRLFSFDNVHNDTQSFVVLFEDNVEVYGCSSFSKFIYIFGHTNVAWVPLVGAHSFVYANFAKATASTAKIHFAHLLYQHFEVGRHTLSFPKDGGIVALIQSPPPVVGQLFVVHFVDVRHPPLSV